MENHVAIGAHTIGRAHCSSFSNRLASNDPTLDPTYAATLREACPTNADPLATVPLDPSTPFTFDNNYFSNLAVGRGLLTSDQDLYTNLGTQFATNLNLINPDLWKSKFSNAMIHLSTLNVKFGTLGEIRKNCRFVDWILYNYVICYTPLVDCSFEVHGCTTLANFLIIFCTSIFTNDEYNYYSFKKIDIQSPISNTMLINPAGKRKWKEKLQVSLY